MTSATRRSSRWGGPGAAGGRLAWALLAAWLAGAAAAAGAQTVGDDSEAVRLEALMEGMASTSGVVARFVERKDLALLSTPLVSSGRFVFVPPDRLSRITEEPSPSTLVIDGDRVHFDDGGEDDTLDLSANPVARQYVRNFTALFNGDLEALRERYTLDFTSGPGEAWTLALVPRSATLRQVIERVTLRGSGRALAEMELLETGGDRTLTRFEEVRTDVELDAAELSRLFPEAGADEAAEADAGGS